MYAFGIRAMNAGNAWGYMTGGEGMERPSGRIRLLQKRPLVNYRECVRALTRNKRRRGGGLVSRRRGQGKTKTEDIRSVREKRNRDRGYTKATKSKGDVPPIDRPQGKRARVGKKRTGTREGIIKGGGKKAAVKRQGASCATGEDGRWA